MNKPSENAKLHIFVNGRKFDEHDGVKPIMTGAEIAALVGVPSELAVVRIKEGNEYPEVPVGQSIEIRNGMHFTVTRRVVEGGHE